MILEYKIYFAAVYFRTKLILRDLGMHVILQPFIIRSKIYFAAVYFRTKLILRDFGVQNLFCNRLFSYKIDFA